MKESFNKAVQHLLCFLMWPIMYIATKTNKQDALLSTLCKELENEYVFPSFRLRNKNSVTTPIVSNLCESDYRIGIVLQGPISKKDGLTINSVKYYRKIYPNSIVVVSTWTTEEKAIIDRCIEAGAIVVQSELPKHTGILNVNYQITSSLAGIKKAIEMGADYIAKTRTDQRVCKPYVFYSLISLMNMFPVMDKYAHMKKRLVVMPTYIHNMFTPYFMSDFFYFGESSDLLNLFSLDLDTRSKDEQKTLVTRFDYSDAMYPPEIYVLRSYLRKYTEASIETSIKDYWECIRNYLICVDKNMLDLMIMKYSYSYNDGISDSTNFPTDDENKKLTMKWGFIEWLSLLDGSIVYRNEYEDEMNQLLN